MLLLLETDHSLIPSEQVLIKRTFLKLKHLQEQQIKILFSTDMKTQT